MSRYPEQGLSIVIMCNAGESADRTVTMFARRIFDLFVPATGAQVAENNMPPVAADAMDVRFLFI